MKKLPVVLVVAVVIVALGAMAWLLLEPSNARGGQAIAGPGTGARDLPGSATPLEGLAQPSERQALGVELPPAVAAPVVEVAPVPASYRAALGGVIGRVVDSQRQPVADMTVELLGGGLAEVMPPLDAILRGTSPDVAVELGAARTGADGRFAFSDLEPRILGVLLLDPGGPRAHLQVLEHTPVSGAVRDLGDIVLPACVTLLGRVLDERGGPLPGVRVRATDLQPLVLASGVTDWRADSALLIQDDSRSAGTAFGGAQVSLVIEPPAIVRRIERLLPFPTTTTNAEGRFVLDGVRPGLMSVVADDGRHQALVHGPVPTGEAGSRRDVGDLTMRDGLALRGRVVDDAGQPVPGAEVRAGNLLVIAPVTILRAPITADEQGRFEVDGLREGPVRAVARASAHHGFQADPGGSYAGDELTIVLPGRRRLTLDLRDVSDEPVPEARVFARYLPMDEMAAMPDFVLAPAPRGDAQGLTRDDEGRLVLADLDPGVWDVLVDAEGYSPVRGLHDLRQSDLTAKLDLVPSLGLGLRVVRAADGTAVEHARVTARATGRNRREVPQPVTAERTDADGRARLSDLGAGTFALEVTHPALAVKTLEVEIPLPEEQAAAGGLVIELSTGGSIAGTVLEGGAPPAQVLMVSLAREDDLESSAVMPRLTLMAPDGSFRFEAVDPGEVKLEVRERFEYAGLMTWWEPFAMTPLAEETLVVESGSEVETVLVVGSAWADIPTGWVEGRLLVNGYPGEDWKVRTWDKIRRTVTAGPDGRFNMGQLAAGEELTLLFSAPGQAVIEGAVDTFVFELAEGERRVVEISLTTGSVSGRVLGPDARPVEGAQVSLQARDREGRGWFGRRGGATACDPQGRFSFEPVAEGRYAVEVNAEGYASSTSEEFSVTGRQAVNGVEVRLIRAVSLAGTIRFEGLEATPQWIWLNAESERGEEASANVDLESLAFRFDDMVPERNWTISAYVNTGDELEPVKLWVGGDQEGAVLTFRPEPPGPAEPELTLEAVKALEDLGYVGEGEDGG